MKEAGVGYGRLSVSPNSSLSSITIELILPRMLKESSQEGL